MICRRCGSRIPEDLAVRESFKCPECGRQFGTPAPDRAPAHEERSRYSSRDDRYTPSRYADEPRSTRYASDRYADEPRSSRYASDRYEPESRSNRRASSRFEPEYDDGYSDNQYADNDGYYDAPQYANDGYYDDNQYADNDGYYDAPQYADDDGYYDDTQYADNGYYAPQYAAADAYYDDAPQYTDDDLSDLINGGEPRPAGMKLTTVLTVLILGIMALIAVFCIDAAIHPEEAAGQTAARIESHLIV